MAEFIELDNTAGTPLEKYEVDTYFNRGKLVMKTLPL